jgi:ferric-dicitrate binding protein FerR (iron transport regulator)
MKSDNEIEMNDELIARYLSGGASPEEALALEEWRQEPSHNIHFEELEAAWNRSAAKKKPVFNSYQAWNKIEASMVKEPQPQGKVRFMSKVAWRVAASLVIAVASVVLIVLNWKTEDRYATIATAAEIRVVKLPDQSTVTVYHNTLLDYQEEFKNKTRELKLKKGEAFFQVAPDRQKPFVIHTPVADIRVVGTAFNVITSPNQTEVSVQEGKVWVRSASDSILLTAGASALFAAGKTTILAKDDTDNNVWGYATHRLVFKNTPLKAVIRDIRKVYGCSISVANKNISKCRLTATFDNENIDKVVNLIAEILNLKVKQDGKEYTLEGDGCP